VTTILDSQGLRQELVNYFSLRQEKSQWKTWKWSIFSTQTFKFQYRTIRYRIINLAAFWLGKPKMEGQKFLTWKKLHWNNMCSMNFQMWQIIMRSFVQSIAHACIFRTICTSLSNNSDCCKCFHKHLRWWVFQRRIINVTNHKFWFERYL